MDMLRDLYWRNIVHAWLREAIITYVNYLTVVPKSEDETERINAKIHKLRAFLLARNIRTPAKKELLDLISFIDSEYSAGLVTALESDYAAEIRRLAVDLIAQNRKCSVLDARLLL